MRSSKRLVLKTDRFLLVELAHLTLLPNPYQTVVSSSHFKSEGSTLAGFPSLLNALFLSKSSIWLSTGSQARSILRRRPRRNGPPIWVLMVCVRRKVFFSAKRGTAWHEPSAALPQNVVAAEHAVLIRTIGIRPQALEGERRKPAGPVRWTEGSESADWREVGEQPVLLVGGVWVNCVRLRVWVDRSCGSVTSAEPDAHLRLRWRGNRRVPEPRRTEGVAQAPAGRITGVSPGRWRTSNVEPSPAPRMVHGRSAGMRPVPRMADGPGRCERETPRWPEPARLRWTVMPPRGWSAVTDGAGVMQMCLYVQTGRRCGWSAVTDGAVADGGDGGCGRSLPWLCGPVESKRDRREDRRTAARE